MSGTRDKSASADKIKRKLLVSSARGNPEPANGYTLYDDGSQVTCKINNPMIEDQKGWITTVWTCEGWSGTGSVPPKGVGTDVTFPITEDSTIIWNWSSKTRARLTPSRGQVGTLISLACVFTFAVVSYVVWRDVLLTAVFTGAIGGLVHEIVQSNGTYMLPHMDTANSNFCLGGLIGIISGGAAGVIMVEGLTVTTLSRQLIALAFTAGLALKGVADAAGTKTPSNGSPPSPQKP